MCWDYKSYIKILKYLKAVYKIRGLLYLLLIDFELNVLNSNIIILI